MPILSHTPLIAKAMIQNNLIHTNNSHVCSIIISHLSIFDKIKDFTLLLTATRSCIFNPR